MEKPLTEIKLIAIDIDGTLLDPDGEITARVRGAIEAAQRAGIIVTLATARRYFSTREIADMLGLELPLIVYDGALIVNHPAQTILRSQPLSAHVAGQVVEIFRRYNIQPVVQPCDGLLEAVWTGPAEWDHPELATYTAAAGERLCRMSYEQLRAGRVDPLRVVAFASQEAIQRLIPAVSVLACSWSRLSMGSYNCAELAIMHPGCSKASGVAALAALYDIPLAQVMAIGDNTNDIAMLQTVGWGVAMGQASAVVKAAARAITASNQEDGVALAIEQYALAQRPHVVPLRAVEMTAPRRSFPMRPDQVDKALASD
jgi:Cof subfamily protein (haloacid dehalogenase superfamily)